MRRLLAIPAVALGLAIMPLVGCSTADSQQVTAQEYSQPRETVRAAQQVGADEVPRANLFLTYATEQLEGAEKALQEGNHRQARLLLARAQADAELALTLAQEGQLSDQVEQIDNRIEQIRQESQVE